MQLTRSLIAVSLLFCSLPACAIEAQEGSVTKTEELPPPFKTAGKFSHAIQKYSGLNFVSNAVASATATAALSTYLRGRARVKVRGYNFTDLMQGEFRSIDVKVGSGKVKGVPIGALHARSTTPFKVNPWPWKKEKVGLVTPVMVSLDGELSEKMAAKALKSKAVTDNLRFLKLDLPGLGSQTLQVLDPKVTVDGERITVDTNLITAGAAPETGIRLKVAAHPVIEKERYVILKDMEVESENIENPKAFADFADQLLNPLIDFGRMDRKTHAFRVTNLTVKDDRLNFGGRLLLAPKPKN
jgi:hypothetical protein